MAQQQWQIGHATGCCATTGRRFEEGEAFYTVLFEDGESFGRADYSVDVWKGPPEGAYCFFKTHVPVKEKRKKLLVDDELLINFFRRLELETEPVRIRFRFVLALILMRKRLLRYEESAVEEGEEVWRMTLVCDRSAHRVINPRLTDDQIDDVSQQLSAILHSDMGEWALEHGEDNSEPREEDRGNDQTS